MAKIALITTYPPFKCGIGIYAQHLARSLRDAGEGDELFVLSEGGLPELEGASIQVEQTYSRNGEFERDVVARLLELKPKVAHFQHAPDLFPDNDALVSMLSKVAGAGIPTYITLHSVYQSRKWRKIYARLDGVVDFIVHNTLSRTALQRTLKRSGVHVIPHGTSFPALPSKEEARARLSLPSGEFLFMFFGAIHAGKNLHTAVRAFRRLAKCRAGVRMVVAGGAAQSKLYNHLYVLGNKVIGRGSDSFIWRTTYIPDEEVPHYIAAADTLLLPYWQKYNSSSGVFHQAMAASCPVICSDSPKFSEIKRSLSDHSPVFVPALRVSKWVKAMRRMVDDEGLRSEIGSTLRSYGEQTAWDVVGRMHLEAFGIVD